MVENLDFKLDAIMNALTSLSYRTADIEGVMTSLHNDGASVVAPSRAYQARNSEETT